MLFRLVLGYNIVYFSRCVDKLLFTFISLLSEENRCRTGKRRGQMNGIRRSVLQTIQTSSHRFSSFFAQHRNSVKKITHRKKNRGHRTSKIVKSPQSYSNVHLPYILIVSSWSYESSGELYRLSALLVYIQKFND